MYIGLGQFERDTGESQKTGMNEEYLEKQDYNIIPLNNGNKMDKTGSTDSK